MSLEPIAILLCFGLQRFLDIDRGMALSWTRAAVGRFVSILRVRRGVVFNIFIACSRFECEKLFVIPQLDGTGKCMEVPQIPEHVLCQWLDQLCLLLILFGGAICNQLWWSLCYTCVEGRSLVMQPAAEDLGAAGLMILPWGSKSYKQKHDRHFTVHYLVDLPLLTVGLHSYLEYLHILSRVLCCIGRFGIQYHPSTGDNAWAFLLIPRNTTRSSPPGRRQVAAPLMQRTATCRPT